MHEVLNVQTCPLCGGRHSYRLAVETNETGSPAAVPLRKRRVRFEGAFPCPVKGTSFRGSATLLTAPGEAIASVKVTEVEAAAVP